MEPIKDIIQKELYEVVNNPIDQAGNRIKLRGVSHENLVRHLKNIPYQEKSGSKIVSSHINLPNESKKWVLTPKQYMSYLDGPNNPINVKENMLENIKKHYEVVDVRIAEDKTEQYENTVRDSVVANQFVDNSTQEENDIVDNKNVITQFSDVAPSSNADDKIEDIREQLARKNEIVAQIEKETEEFEKRAQEQAIKYTEVQKQIQDAKQKYSEILLKREQLEKSQHVTMVNMNKNLDIRIEELTKRRDKSKLLTEDYDLKINKGIEEFQSINDNIAREEEYIRALSFDGEVEIPYVDKVEQVIKRVA